MCLLVWLFFRGDVVYKFLNNLVYFNFGLSLGVASGRNLCLSILTFTACTDIMKNIKRRCI